MQAAILQGSAICVHCVLAMVQYPQKNGCCLMKFPKVQGSSSYRTSLSSVSNGMLLE